LIQEKIHWSRYIYLWIHYAVFEETVTKVLGRGVKIKYNPVKKTGSILLDFYRLEDLTDILAALGYAPKEDY